MAYVDPRNYYVIPFFGAEFGFLKWNFHVLFPVYININYWNKMEFYVKFGILKWNFQNINTVILVTLKGVFTLDMVFPVVKGRVCEHLTMV